MHDFISSWTAFPSAEKASKKCSNVTWFKNNKQLGIFVAFVEHFHQNFRPSKNQNHQASVYKNYDDCVSRFMTSMTFELSQLNLELGKLRLSPMRIHPFQYHPKCGMAYGLDNGVVVIRLDDRRGDNCYYWLNTYGFYSKRIQDKGISPEIVCELILTYYNMRCHSGTNWSPEETYDTLDTYVDGGYSIYECFASLLNNQNTINYPKQPMTYVFTKWPIDQQIESYVRGSWFDDVLTTAKADPNPKKVFYVNPPFSEEVTIWAFRGVDQLLTNFPDAKVIMCLPAWYDMFDGGNTELWAIIQKWGYHQKVLHESWVRNFNERKFIKFPFIIGYINV
jgi:hypothetical protein